MVLAGRFKSGFAVFIAAAALAVVLLSSWAFFAYFGTVLYEAAAGQVTEARHLQMLYLLQKNAMVLIALLAVFLVVLLVLLVESYLSQQKNAERLVAEIQGFARGDWHPEPCIKAGDELDNVAAALAVLAKDIKSGGCRLLDDASVEEVKSKFLEIITHQLRTPLTAIRWNLESLLRGEVGRLTKRQEDILRVNNKNYGNVLVMLSDWAEAYGEQTVKDHAALLKAIESGRVIAQ